MTWTGIAKWQDGPGSGEDDTLTIYCGNDESTPHDFQSLWDNAQEVLEIRYNSSDWTLKWDDAGNTLEARAISDGICPSPYDCDCWAPDETPIFAYVTISGVTDCNPLKDCTEVNGTWTCENSLGDPCQWEYEGSGVYISLSHKNNTAIVKASRKEGAASWPCFCSEDAGDNCEKTGTVSGDNCGEGDIHCGGSASWTMSV